MAAAEAVVVVGSAAGKGHDLFVLEGVDTCMKHWVSWRVFSWLDMVWDIMLGSGRPSCENGTK